MGQQTKYHGGIMDSLKWASVFALAGIAIAGNYHYSDQSVLIRAIAVLVIAASAAFIGLKTSKGQKFWQFAMDARNELRKVVWPSRQETIQTTFMVLGIVVFVGLVLWGVDSLLLKVVALITGYGAN